MGIASRNPVTAKARAERFAIAAVYTDPVEAVAALRPDVVDICSPVERHLAHVRLAADAGAAILCQKPLAATLAEAIAAAEAARDAGVRLMVHENFRFRPWFRAAKTALDAGRIGEPFYLRSDLRLAGTVPTARHPEPWSLARQPFFRQMPRLLVLESMIHQIDVARFLLGAEPTAVVAMLRRVSPDVVGEDLASLMLRFPSAHAVLERSYATLGEADPPAVSEELRVEGTGGLLRVLRDGTTEIVTETASGRREERLDVDLDDAYARSYAATIAHFAAALRDGTPFETGPADNLRTLDATLAAYRSAEAGTVEPLPSPELAALLGIAT
ncbi:putative dehydrogenase [Amaricoccus macauensis]|uniref:Putative dehydrogenase n=1 Tax=Amaricoccus macauensis TaxID=57001 RepID=A0A840SH68_9RHOB|nr:putative dehydrogenase [Amaricoccus macauensis]